MWFNITNNEVKLQIIAKPNAKRSKLLAITNEGLQIAIHASPREGEANKELINYISLLFNTPKSQISLLRGDKSKHKQVIMPLTTSINGMLNEPGLLLLRASSFN